MMSEDDPGPKPPDYMTIHKLSSMYKDERNGIRITVDTHYINHSGEWTSTGPCSFIDLIWPESGSQYVAVNLEDLRLVREATIKETVTVLPHSRSLRILSVGRNIKRRIFGGASSKI